jgi:hypothetical protein
MMGQVPGPGDDESLKESVPGLFRSGEMMRHLKLSIEQEVVRAIEGVDLAEIRRCYRDQDEFVVVDGPPVAASAGDSDRGSIGMADGPGGQAGARGDPSSLDPDPRSHHRASRWADRTTPHEEPNQVRSYPRSVVSLGRSLLAHSCLIRPVCSGHACAELTGY